MAERRHRLISVATRAIVSVIILAAGGAVFAFLFLIRPSPPVPEETQVARDVLVMRPRVLTVHRTWAGFGAARAMDSAAVPAEVTAVVIEVPQQIRAGAHVEHGTVLARLDPTDFQREIDLIVEQRNAVDAELEQLDIEEASWQERLVFAEDEERIAEADFSRVRELVTSGDATELELDRSAAALAAARRALSAIREEFNKAGPRRLRLRAQRQALVIEERIAQKNLERTTIVSPIAGTVEAVSIDEGEQVIAGQTVAFIVDASRIEVEIRLPASARLDLREGDEAKIVPAGVPNRRWTGHVARIGPSDDEATRTFPVYVEVDQDADQAGALTPGLYVEASVRSALAEDRMLVPRQAVLRGRVFAVESGRLVPRDVEIAFHLSGDFPELGLPEERYWAALADPLPVDSLVVVNGATEIPTGTTVRPVETSAADRADSSRQVDLRGREIP